jgi:hypothetical protein
MAKRKGPTMIQRSRAVSPQDKAVFHAVTGAGKARTKRDFFNLGPGDEAEIERMLQRRVSDRMQRGTT